MLYHCDDLNVKIYSVQRVENKKGERLIKGRNFHALVFRVRGSAQFTLENGEEIFSNTSNVFFISSGISYRVKYTQGETIAIHFQADEYSVPCENYPLPFKENIYVLFEKMLNAWKNRANAMRIKSLFYELLSVLREEELKKTGEQDGLKKVVVYMNENYFNAEMNVAQACRTCGVSESNFRAKFKKKYAKTPIEYLMELRLENAIRLLSIGEESIESIAEKSGFSDVKYFARVIKKKFGLPPSQLAKTLFV